LDLTVEDSNGDPISGANITIFQNEMKEFFKFETDENGRIVGIHEQTNALLSNVHQYGNNTTSTIEY